MLTIVMVFTKSNDLANKAIKSYEKLFESELYHLEKVVVENRFLESLKVGKFFPTFTFIFWPLTNTKFIAFLMHVFTKNLLNGYQGQIEKAIPDILLSIDPLTNAGLGKIASEMKLDAGIILLTPFTIHQCQLLESNIKLFAVTNETREILKRKNIKNVKKVSWPLVLSELTFSCSCGKEIILDQCKILTVCINLKDASTSHLKKVLKQLHNSCNLICIGNKKNHDRLQDFLTKNLIEVTFVSYAHRFHVLQIADFYVSQGDSESIFDAFISFTIPFIIFPRDYKSYIASRYLKKQRLAESGDLKNLLLFEKKDMLIEFKKRGAEYTNSLQIFSQELLSKEMFYE